MKITTERLRELSDGLSELKPGRVIIAAKELHDLREAVDGLIEARDGKPWPEWSSYQYLDRVEKFTGEARWEGLVVAAYLTSKGGVRYVVEVQPQGFQMIAVPSQLRPWMDLE